jgi:hypothetical protein
MVIESWQIYDVAQKYLPTGTLQRIYRRSCRLIYYWAADPRFANETKRNPIDRTRQLLAELKRAGYSDEAEAAIDFMAEPLGGEFAAKETAKSDKRNVDGETADCMVALGKLADEIRYALADNHLDTAERIRIKSYSRQVISEVEQLLDAAGVK